MDRKDAPQNLKWNFEDIYPSHQDWQKEYDALSKLCLHFADFKGKLGQKEKLLEFYLFDDEFSKRFDKLGSYSFLNGDIDNKNNQFIEDNQKIDMLSAKIGELTAFVGPELASLPNVYFEEVLKDKRFADYDHSVDAFLRGRKFVLSEKEEQALETTSKYSGGFGEVFESLTQSDFCFEPVCIDGVCHKLTQSNYGEFLENKDEVVRQQTYDNLYKQYRQFSKTLAMNYISFVKMCCSDLKLRKQKSYLSASFYLSKMPQKIYTNLIEQVDKNIALEKEYFKLLRQKVSAKNFGFKDVYLSLATNSNKKYSIDQQKQIVLEALSPLGTDYQSLLKKSYAENWIDFCRGDNKSSGGYMLDVYGVHPFVLLNDNANYDSLSTLAHELGHAMHTYYSNQTQPYDKHHYATFIAEIASTVNEILLGKYMTKNASNDEEKLFYIDNYLQSFKSTVFRQTMFSEFEYFAFEKIEKDEVLSPNILEQKYKSLLEKHFGDIVPIDQNIVHEYQRIPHFYTPFYVFQYATSFVCACFIAGKILAGDKKMIANYKNMLSSGGKDYPTKILAKVGIDLTKPDTFCFAFDDMKKSLVEAKKIIARQDKNQNK